METGAWGKGGADNKLITQKKAAKSERGLSEGKKVIGEKPLNLVANTIRKFKWSPSGQKASKRVGGMGWGRGFRQRHSCPCRHRASHPPLPATNWHLVSVCVFGERGCQPTETRGMVPRQKTHHRDENLVPKECIGSTGRVSPRSRSRAAQHRQEGPKWRMRYGAVWGDSHWASGHTDAQRRPPHGNTGRWRGCPLSKGWGHAATWTHKHQGLGQFRKRDCTVLRTLPRCNPTFTQQPPASGSSVISRAYWLRSMGTKMKTIQIPLSKWSPQARNSEGLPPETTTRKTLVSPPTVAVLVTSSSLRIKQKTVFLHFFLCTIHHHILWGPLQSPWWSLTSYSTHLPGPPDTHTVTSLFWAVQMCTLIYTIIPTTRAGLTLPSDTRRPCTFSREPSRKFRPEVLSRDMTSPRGQNLIQLFHH